MSSQTQPTLFLIRHGEKPALVNGKEPDGLSDQGQQRADGLRKVFGKESSYNIGHIMAEEPKSGLYFLFYFQCA
jgi:broad specificity phosphatase PhoE